MDSINPVNKPILLYGLVIGIWYDYARVKVTGGVLTCLMLLTLKTACVVLCYQAVIFWVCCPAWLFVFLTRLPQISTAPLAL